MRQPGKLTRRERWFSIAVYRLTKLRLAGAKFRYRKLNGRCYACPGRYGEHKFSCSVGIKEASLDRD